MTLIDRLSKLDGANRRLDHEMHILFFVPDDKKDTVEWNHQGSYICRPADGFINFDTVPAYTASIDAAISLAERVLPGHQTGYLPSFFKDSAYAGIVSEKGKAVDLLKSTIEGGPTPAIALCIAILRAKEASHGE